MIQILNNWKIVLIAIFLTLSIVFIKKSINQAKEINRVSNNFIELQKDNSVLNLNISEFKTYLATSNTRLDSVLKASKIKPKKVLETNTITITQHDTLVRSFPIMKLDKTIISGGINFKLSIGDSVRISDINYKNSADLIIYKKFFSLENNLNR